MIDYQRPACRAARPPGPRYKWMALFVSTLGMLMATIDSTITLIALPDIFRGIGIDPLDASNSFFLLWMILGFSVVTSVVVTAFGRMGDIVGRVRTYNLGFAVFTLFSLLLTVTWMHGRAAAVFLIVLRLFQAVGAAMLMANSVAILTDAFPVEQRGMAIGINQAAAFSGTFIGLALGGILAPVNWRLVFLVSVPIGLFATVLGYLRLRELSPRQQASIDWAGNITFAVGLVLVMIAITYGIEPYGSSALGWTNPLVLALLAAGAALLAAFGVIESRVAHPMVRLRLFRIRPFAAGVLATLLASLARGGLMFVLVIWLQGIWLPLHGYDFSVTPLKAGIAMVPLSCGFLVSGPLCGMLSDRYGARVFATGGMIGTAVAFALFEVLPTDFSYWVFGLLLFCTGLVMACFGSANRAAVMNSLPPADRERGRPQHHLPERRTGPVDRHLLHPDDCRAVRVAPRQPVPRPGRARHPGRDRRAHLAPAPGVHHLRRVPWLQPGQAPGGHAPARPAAGRPAGGPARSRLLPVHHLRPVPRRPAYRP